jgi:benzoate-CoA ligase (EC 6.2.1.25)
MSSPLADVAPPPERFNFAAHLLAANATRGAKPAFVDDTGALSYAQLDERVRRMATALRSLYLRREERVMVLMHDGNDWPVAFLGSLYAGLVPVAVNTLLTADDYAYMLEHSRAQAVLVSGALLPTLNSAMVKSDHEVQKVIVSRPLAPLHPSEVEFDAFLAAHAPQDKPAPTSADDPAFWLYSSGSTGAPRAPCIRTPTPTGLASCTASACWACRKAMSASRPPSCSSPTAWATASASR